MDTADRIRWMASAVAATICAAAWTNEVSTVVALLSRERPRQLPVPGPATTVAAADRQEHTMNISDTQT